MVFLVKWSRYRPGVAQRVGRGVSLLFHNRGTRRGWVVSSMPRPHFTPGKDPVPIWQEAGWAPGPVWTGKKSRPRRNSIPDRPARSQSLYRLSYPAHLMVFLRNKKNITLRRRCRRMPWWKRKIRSLQHFVQKQMALWAMNSFSVWKKYERKQANANNVVMVSCGKRETCQTSVDSGCTPYLTTPKDKQSKYLDSYLATIRTCIWMWPRFPPLLHVKGANIRQNTNTILQ